MRCRLGLCINGDETAAVTTCTLAIGTGVIHAGTGERKGIPVTGIALD
jgi:hypothetical protein